MNEPLPLQSYMKGKSKHWFWGVPAAVLLGIWLNYSFNILQGVSMSGAVTVETLRLDAALFSLIACGSMAAVLLGYGLGSAVNLYRALFLTLACAQLPAAAGSYLSRLGTIDATAHGTLYQNLPFTIALFVLTALSLLSWLACLTVFACSRRSNGLVRASAILLALYLLAQFGWSFGSGFVLIDMSKRMEASAVVLILSAVNLVSNALYLLLTAFFFATVSFTRPRRADSHVEAAGQGHT